MVRLASTLLTIGSLLALFPCISIAAVEIVDSTHGMVYDDGALIVSVVGTSMFVSLGVALVFLRPWRPYDPLRTAYVLVALLVILLGVAAGAVELILLSPVWIGSVAILQWLRRPQLGNVVFSHNGEPNQSLQPTGSAGG